MSIPISELDIRSNEAIEQERARKVWESIRESATSNKPLTEHEKNFFCICLNNSHWNDGDVKDYSICANYIFKWAYFVYRHDITGANRYYKPDKNKVREEFRKNNGKPIEDLKLCLREVGIVEKQNDLEYLQNEANNWEKEILKNSHSERLMQYIVKEARKEVKGLDEQPEFKIPYAKGNFRYNNKKQSIFLYSKYLYLLTLEVFESMKPEDFILKLNGIDVEFNEYSIVHILNRHYSAGVKQYYTGKSFHNPDFIPRQLNLQLRVIFEMIENSGYYKNDSIQKISFQFKETNYRIYTEERYKQEPGKGNVLFTRVETFYPINDENQLADLSINYKCAKINSDLGVYCHI